LQKAAPRAGPVSLPGIYPGGVFLLTYINIDNAAFHSGPRICGF
jgi:hypothetical protein